MIKLGLPMLKHRLLKWMGVWPPFLGAGIRVARLSRDFSEIDVEMGLHAWNQNYVGTQFGGSLYAMTDPFYMLMLMEKLGPEYIVWDKAASIRFKKPGRGRVRAEFRLSDAEVDAIREQLKTERKVEPMKQVLVKNDAGEVIAEVDKLLYVRKK
jgi:hypothetical protein